MFNPPAICAMLLTYVSCGTDSISTVMKGLKRHAYLLFPKILTRGSQVLNLNDTEKEKKGPQPR